MGPAQLVKHNQPYCQPHRKRQVGGNVEVFHQEILPHKVFPVS
jgi:hypothetical protein